MALTNTAAFAQTPKTSTALTTGADDLTSAPANTVLVATAGTDGALVTGLTASPRATVTVSSLHLFISKDSGTNKILLDGALMAAHTVAATTAVPVTVFTRITETTALRLEAGDELYVGSGVALAGGIAFTAQWTNF
jgi:hypothetical protein